MLKKTPPIFWLDVLKQLCLYNFIQTNHTEDPRNKILWFNSNIKIKNKVVYNKTCHEKNFIYLNDLQDQNGNLMSFCDFQAKYKTRLTFLHYLGLLGAIPNRYKELLAQTISKPKTPKLTMLIQCKQKLTKLLYENMIEETDVFPTKAYQKHESELDTELSKEGFLNLFLNTLSSTASTKLWDIQFRILHHTLITNETLSKWGVLNDSRCTFCHGEIESIAHLLIRCRYATNVWKHIENSLQNAGVTIVLTEVEKLLGIANNENTVETLYNTVNFC